MQQKPASIRVSITFTQKGKTLTRYEADLHKPEDFREAIDAAHEQFRRENPRVLLFDGVTTIYDKAG